MMMIKKKNYYSYVSGSDVSSDYRSLDRQLAATRAATTAGVGFPSPVPAKMVATAGMEPVQSPG